jgi:hypothetical protein
MDILPVPAERLAGSRPRTAEQTACPPASVLYVSGGLVSGSHG